MSPEWATALGIALGSGFGYGVPLGVKKFFDYLKNKPNGKGTNGKSNGKGTNGKNLTSDSNPPTSEPDVYSQDKDIIRRAARSAGFKPGQTGSYEMVSTLGPMRCDGHALLVKAVDEVKIAAQEAKAAASTAASSASEAKTAANESKSSIGRMEATLKDEGDRMRTSLKEVVDTMGNFREWKGKMDGTADHHEGQIAALWHEVRTK